MHRKIIEILNFARWRPATWILFLAWLAVAIVGNLPLRVTQDGTKVVPYPKPIETMQQYGYSYGWPIQYLAKVSVQPNGQLLLDIRTEVVVIDVCVVSGTLLAIIVLMNRINQFLIQSLLASVAAIAILLAIDAALKSNPTHSTFRYFFAFGVYLAPIPFALATPIWNYIYHLTTARSHYTHQVLH